MDKKAEKAALSSYTAALASQLDAQTEPAAALSLAVPLLIATVHGKAVALPGRTLAAATRFLKPDVPEHVHVRCKPPAPMRWLRLRRCYTCAVGLTAPPSPRWGKSNVFRSCGLRLMSGRLWGWLWKACGCLAAEPRARIVEAAWAVWTPKPSQAFMEQYCGDVMQLLKSKAGGEQLGSRLPQLKAWAKDPQSVTVTEA
jgi:hypothetical protein